MHQNHVYPLALVTAKKSWQMDVHPHKNAISKGFDNVVICTIIEILNIETRFP